MKVSFKKRIRLKNRWSNISANWQDLCFVPELIAKSFTLPIFHKISINHEISIHCTCVKYNNNIKLKINRPFLI